MIVKSNIFYHFIHSCKSMYVWVYVSICTLHRNLYIPKKICVCLCVQVSPYVYIHIFVSTSISFVFTVEYLCVSTHIWVALILMQWSAKSNHCYLHNANTQTQAFKYHIDFIFQFPHSDSFNTDIYQFLTH